MEDENEKQQLRQAKQVSKGFIGEVIGSDDLKVICKGTE